MAKEFNDSGYSILRNEEIYDGIHSKVESVTMSKGKHRIPLIRKYFRGYDIEFMDGPKWHTLLKKRGYPVIPTWRYDEKNKVEYLTDLRKGGTHRVVDFCGDPSNYNKAFISNLKEVEQEVKKLLDKSVSDGLVINEPNIIFDIEISTGKAAVLIGDTRELGYESSDESDCPSSDDIRAHNEWVLGEHLKKLKQIAQQNN